MVELQYVRRQSYPLEIAGVLSIAKGPEYSYCRKERTSMRLLAHNALRNNSAAAEGKGYPLKITATEIRVDDHDHDRAKSSSSSSDDDASQRHRREVEFARSCLSMLLLWMKKLS